MFKRIGPGFFVAAAFIGPGTVITCATSGIQFGSSVLWALIFGVLITILFQEMAARLAVYSGTGLSESILTYTKSSFLKTVFKLVVIASVFVGNAAYESGNILGASIGAASFIGSENYPLFIGLVSAVVFTLLLIGKNEVLEKVFVFLVFFMGSIFVVLLLFTDLSQAFKNSFQFSSFDDTDYLFVSLSLIGTTVVPYNLFLHSRSIHKKWGNNISLTFARKDLIFSILIGGLISTSILLVFAGTSSGITDIKGLVSITDGLESAYGVWAKYLVSLGIFCAGLTSSLTAPLAASYAISGLFNFEGKKNKQLEKFVWQLVLISGVVVGLTDIQPIFLIQLAQFANGLLLPFVAIILIYTLNKVSAVEFKNGTLTNIAGVIVVIFLVILGSRSILNALGIW